MQTSLSRARTLAPSASIAAISAWSPPLLLNFSLPLSLFPLHPPSLFQPNPYLSLFYLFSRFSIDPQSDPEALFRITPDTGLITTAMELDREREHWHNITVIATQRGQGSLLVGLFAMLDVNGLSVGLYRAKKALQRMQHFNAADVSTL